MSEIASFYQRLDAAGLWHRSRTLKRAEYLLLPGHRDRGLYYVERGSLVATVEVSGEEQCMRFAYSGEMVTAFDTHLTGMPSAYGFRALRHTRVRAADYGAYQDLLQRDPELMALWQRLTQWLVLGLLERELDLLTPSPEERYRRVLQRSPRLFQEVPAKYIANYLRMTPETLSRLGRERE